MRQIGFIAYKASHSQFKERNSSADKTLASHQLIYENDLSDQLETRSPGKIIAIGEWSSRTALVDGGIAVIDCNPTSVARVGS